MIRPTVLESEDWVLHQMHKLLALDQSSKTTGWAVFYDNELIEYGNFTFEDKDLGERLYKIRNKVSYLIADYDINEIAFEDIQLQQKVNGEAEINNVSTFKTLAEVFGVIYELVIELELPYNIVLSSSWKAKLGIKGKYRNEQKANAYKWAVANYSIEGIQDEADAICIGAYVIQMRNKKPDYDWS